MIISEKSLDTSMPSVMYAITRLMTSRFFSGSRSIAGLRSDAFSSFTSPFLFSPVTPPVADAMLSPRNTPAAPRVNQTSPVARYHPFGTAGPAHLYSR